MGDSLMGGGYAGTLSGESVFCKTAEASPSEALRGDSQAHSLTYILSGVAERPEDWRKYNPDRLEIRLFGSTIVPFDRVSMSMDGDHAVWIGRTPTTSDGDEGWVVAVSDKKGWTANVSFAAGGTFNVFAGSQAVVTEASEMPRSCGAPIPDPTAQQPLVAAAEIDAVHHSDVAFLYDEEAEQAASHYASLAGTGQTPLAFMENGVRSMVEIANIYLSQSGVDNLAWRFDGIARIPAYSIDGDDSGRADLEMLWYGTTEAGAFAKEFREARGADQLMLVVGGVRTVGGRAYRPGHLAMMVYSSGVFWTDTMAHELAHNFGCGHDRVTMEALDDDGVYHYGYVFTVNGVDHGTIMSYRGKDDLYYFSNPDVTYKGVPTGIAAGEPQAADNARVLRENAVSMAAYDRRLGAPQIMSQPIFVPATEGGSFSLSLTVTGDNLTYTWFKDGGQIEGSNSSIFTVSNASQADAGSYVATISNEVDSVTSDLIEVTVSAPKSTVPNSGSGGSAGGGGGGGAPSHWFMGALVLLIGLRHYASSSLSVDARTVRRRRAG